MSQYDPNVVIQAADAKFHANDLDGAQNVYKTALLDWVDDATMSGSDLGIEPEKMREAIASLWLAYARLNRKANMNKSATEVYEQAVNCPVSRTVVTIWLEYARFLAEREKHRTAQKIFLRALVGDGTSEAVINDENDKGLLWNEFLQMMQKLNNNPALTLEELRRAVDQEHVSQFPKSEQQNVEPPTIAEAASNASGDLVCEEDPPAKRMKTEEVEPAPTAPPPAPATVVPAKVITAKDIESAAASLLGSSKNLPPDITASWLARDGGAPPSRPEPPLFSPSPPKLGDPSGKDLLGDELALHILQMLTNKGTGSDAGTLLLDICRACWMMTALKEREAAKALERLDKRMNADLEALESDLEARRSVAGAAIHAVEQANESQRNEFISHCNMQRQQLLDFSAWEFRKLLFIQQQILTKANLPSFDGPSVDSSTIALQANVCAVMHSAFYLRGKIGEAPHLVMLKKQETVLSTKKKQSQPPSQKSQQQAPHLVNAPPQYQVAGQPVQHISQPMAPPAFQQVPYAQPLPQQHVQYPAGQPPPMFPAPPPHPPPPMTGQNQVPPMMMMPHQAPPLQMMHPQGQQMFQQPQQPMQSQQQHNPPYSQGQRQKRR